MNTDMRAAGSLDLSGMRRKRAIAVVTANTELANFISKIG
jgi:hypothetical protein